MQLGLAGGEVGGDFGGVFDAPEAGDVALDGCGFLGGLEEGPFGLGGGFGVDGGDDGGDVVGFEEVGEGGDVAVVDLEDVVAEFFFFFFSGLEILLGFTV